MRLLVTLLVSLAVPFTLARDALSLGEDDNGLASDEYYEYYEVEEDMDHEVPERLRQYIKSLPNPMTVETNFSPHDDLISSSGKVHDSKYGRESNTQSSSKQHKRLGKHQKHNKRQRKNEQQKKEKDIKHHKIPDNTLNEATQTISDNVFMDKHEDKSGSYSDRISKEKSSGASLYSPENQSLVKQDGNEKSIGTAHDERKKQTVRLSKYMHEGDHKNVDINNFVSNLPGEQSNQQDEVEHITTMSEFTNSIPSKDKTVKCKTGVECSKDNRKAEFSPRRNIMFNRGKKLKSSIEDNDKYDTIVAEQKANHLDGSDSEITLSGTNSTIQTNEADRYNTSHFTPGLRTDLTEQTGESPSSATRQTYADAVANGLQRQELSIGSLKYNSLQNPREIKELSQTLSNVVTDNNVHKEGIQDQYVINSLPSKAYNNSHVSTETEIDDLHHSGYSSSNNNYDHSILNNSGSILDSGIINNNMEIIKTTVNDHEQTLKNNNKNKINGDNLIISNVTKNDHDELIKNLTQMKKKTTKKTTKKRVKKRQRNNSKSKQQSQVTINNTEVEVSGDRDRDDSELLTELNGLNPYQDGVGQDRKDNFRYETYNYSQSNGQTDRFSNLLHKGENGNVDNSKVTSSIFKKSTDVLANDLTGSNLPNGNVKKNLQYPKKVEVLVQSPFNLVTESTINREDSQNKYLINKLSPSKSFNYSIMANEERGGSLDHTSDFHVVNHDDHFVPNHPSSLTPNSDINVNSMDITKQVVSKQNIKENNKNNNKINEEKLISLNGANSDHEQVIEDDISQKAKKATTKNIKKRIKRRRRNKSKQQHSQVNVNNTEITGLKDGDEDVSELNSQNELDDLKLFPNGLGRNGNDEFVNTSFPNQSNKQTKRVFNFLPEEDHKSVGSNEKPSNTTFEKPPDILPNDLTRSELSTGELINNFQKDNEFAHTSSHFVTEGSVSKGDIKNLPSHSMVEDNNSTLISGIDVNNMEINKQLARDGKQYTKESIKNNNKINEDYLITTNGTKNDHEQVIEDFIGHLAKKATKKTIKKRIKKKFRNKSKTKQKQTTKEKFKKTKNIKLIQTDKERDNIATHTEDVYQNNPIDGYSQEEIDENKHVIQRIEDATGNNIARSSVSDQDIVANKSDYVLQTNKNLIEHKNLTSHTTEEFNQNEGSNNVNSEISKSSEDDMKKDSKKEGTYMGQTEAENVNTTQTHSRIQENINDISSSKQGKLDSIIPSYKPVINKYPADSKILESLTSRPVKHKRDVVSNKNYLASGDAKEMNSIDGKVKHTKNGVSNNNDIVSEDAKETNSIDGKVEHTRDVVSNNNDIVSGDAKETNSIYGKVEHTRDVVSNNNDIVSGYAKETNSIEGKVKHTRNVVSNNNYIVSGDAKETNSIDGKVKHTKNVMSNNKYIVSGDAKETNSIDGKVKHTKNVMRNNKYIVSDDAKETNSIDGKVKHTKNVMSNNKYIVSGDAKDSKSIDGKVKHTRNVVSNNNNIVLGDAKDTNSIDGKVKHTKNVVSNNNYIVSGDAKETNSIDGKVKHTRNVVSNNNNIVLGDAKDTNSIDAKVKHMTDVVSNNNDIVSGDAKETNSIDGKVKHTRNVVSNNNNIVSGDAKDTNSINNAKVKHTKNVVSNNKYYIGSVDAKETNSVDGKSHTNASLDQYMNITSNALTSNSQPSLLENTADRDDIRDDVKPETLSENIFESSENNKVSQTNVDDYSTTENDSGNSISTDCLNNNCIVKPHIERSKTETNLHSNYVPQEWNGRTKFDSVKSDTDNSEKDGYKNVTPFPKNTGYTSNVIEHKTDTKVQKGSNGCTNVICSINALKLSNLCKNINKIINLADQDNTGSTYEIVIKVQTNSNGEQNNDKNISEGPEQIKANNKDAGSELNSLTKFTDDNHFMNSINNKEYKLNALGNEISQISKYQTNVKSPIKLDMVKMDQSNGFSNMNIDNLPLDTVIEEDITTKIKTIAGNRLVSKIIRKKSVTRSQPLRDSVPNQFKS